MKTPKDPKVEANGERAGSAAAPGTTSGDRARAPLVELGLGAAWLVGLGAANQIANVAFASNPLAALVVQAVVVDLAVGKAGVRWDAKADGASETKDALRGIGIGAGVALGVAGAVIGVSAALGWAKVGVHAPNTTMGLGLLRAAAIGVRDTLLYAGLPLYFVGRAGAPRVAGVVFGGLAAGAALSLHPAATPANVALAAAVIVAAGALWARKGAGWAAAGVVGGWALFAGAMFRGGLFDVDWKKGALAPGFAADGAPAWIAAGLFVAAAAAALRGGGGRRAARPAVDASPATGEVAETAGAGEAGDEEGSPAKPAAKEPEQGQA